MGGNFSFRVSAAMFLLFACFVGCVFGGVLFSKLPQTLIVTASPKQGQVLMAGEDKIRVSWRMNQSLATSADAAFKTIKAKLCYAPASQENRAWRKTNDDLKKDKTCQFTIYADSNPNTTTTATTTTTTATTTWSFEYLLERDLPTATYFVRVYAVDSDDNQVAYGQTTDAYKTSNLFEIIGITGRHVSLDIAAACFSAFSVLSLLLLSFAEKMKTNK